MNFTIKKRVANMAALQANAPAAAQAAHMGASSSPDYSTSNPVPCLWTGKAVGAGRSPCAPV